LLADVRIGKITRGVFWRPDRLVRTAEGLLPLLDELQPHGVGFVSLCGRASTWPPPPGGSRPASFAAHETEVREEPKAQAEEKRWGGR
jgi:hypothetical protein